MQPTPLQELWTGWDSLILLAYFPAVAAIGYVYRTRSKEGLAQFILAGRALPLPILLGTAFASWYDTWTIMGQAEAVWEMGMALLFIYILPTAIFRVPLALWIGPIFRDRMPEHVYTLPDLLGHLYGERTGKLSSVLILIQLVYSGALLFIVAEAIRLVMGFPIMPTVIVCALVVLFYTTLSGLWATAVTDLFQFVVMTSAGGLLVYFLWQAFGGFSGLAASLDAQDPSLMQPGGHESWPSILAWCVTVLALYTSPQSYQRFGAAKRGKDIQVAYLLVLALGVAYGSVMVIVGLAARASFPELAASEGIWRVIMEALPAGARGLFLVGLASAAMSTLDTDLLWGSTVIVKNIVHEIFGVEMTEERMVRANRIAIPILCGFLVLFTRLFEEGVARAWYYVGGFSAAVFFFPVVGGLVTARRSERSGWLTLVLGLTFYVGWQAFIAPRWDIPSNFATFLVSGAVFFALLRRD